MASRMLTTPLVDFEEEARLLEEEERRLSVVVAEKRRALEEGRRRQAEEKVRKEAEAKAAEEAWVAAEEARVAAEERARKEQQAKEAAEAVEHASERASRTRSPSVEELQPAKKPRREAKTKPKDNKAPIAADYVESVGHTCEGCAKRGIKCLWPRSLAQKRACACFTCVCTGHGCRLGGRLVLTIAQADHPSELQSKARMQPEASGSGARRASPERSGGSRAEQIAEQTLRELQRIHGLLERVVAGQATGNRRLERMLLNLEMLAERGDGAWAIPTTPEGGVPGTPSGSAEEDSEVDVEELEREVADLGQEVEKPEQNPEVEGKGKDRAQ